MSGIPHNASFTTTHWSVVLNARGSSQSAADSLGRLCATYWYPLYAFARHRGYNKEEAEDLTQEFFARLLAGKFLEGVDPAKGKFRTFLLASMKYFLANEWDKAQTQKRGGGLKTISFDAEDPETRYKLEPVTDLSPEKLYERRWALIVIEQTFADLRKGEKQPWFDAVKPLLLGEPDAETYAETAAKLQTTEGALKVAVHRLRQRFGQTLRAIIAETISDPADVESEIAHLIAALA
jgi:RNA polymerase sigma factor (sigma-70 family)